MSAAPEVVVVGGGAFGGSVAYHLARRRVSVLLLDHRLPGCATTASAGGLWPIGEAVGLGCGVIYHADNGSDADGPSPLPDDFRRFLRASHAGFGDVAKDLREITGIDIEHTAGGGLLFLIRDDRERRFVEEVCRALPAEEQPELLSAEEVASLEPHLAPDLLGAARLRGEGQVNPMLVGDAFRAAVELLGGRVRTGACVTGLRRSGDRIVGVELGDEFVPCGTVVNAAGAWAGELAASVGLELPVFPVRGQIVLTETLPRLLSACLSTSSCYLAQKAHGEMLIGSTTEHVGFDVSVTEEAIRSLCRGAMEAVPALRDVRVRRVWAGLRPGTPDELPILGAVPGLLGYANAAGGFRTGIVASPLAGASVAGELCGEDPAPFRLERFHG